MFDVAPEVMWCRQKEVGIARESFISTKKSRHFAQKDSFSYRQKQDDAAQKNILCSKRLLISSGTARHRKLAMLTLLIYMLTVLKK